MERKAEIRKRIIKERMSLAKAVKDQHDQLIARKVIDHPLFHAAKDIFCYIPIKGEVDTKYIIEAAWDAGKRVAVPKVVSKTEMKFYYIRTFYDLLPGTFGVLEPITETVAEPKSACMLVPGSVFDGKGNRIGYGGGYYDRYLEKHSKYDTIALAYSLQIVEEVPVEATDIPMKVIITEDN